MSNDPWAPDPGFERNTGPVATDDFAPLDLQAFDLRDFLRSTEVQRALGRRPMEPEIVTLPDGTRGQLQQRASGNFELTVHLGRDFYQVFSGTRSKVMETAIAAHRRNCARPS